MEQGLANKLALVDPSFMAKITGSIYGDYDYGADNVQDFVTGHYSDKGKMPWHPTFSKESMYSSDNYSGGEWSQDKEAPNVFKRDVFTPSIDMVQSGATYGLAEYFNKVEPNGVLQAPAPYNSSVFSKEKDVNSVKYTMPYKTVGKYVDPYKDVTLPKGVKSRDLYEGEAKYFKANPEVAGMATEDGKVILNPYTGLTPKEYEAVAKNEGTRLAIRNSKNKPMFVLTDTQKKMLEGTTYKNMDIEAQRATIAARLLSGDPSAGKATAEQLAYIKQIQEEMEGK